MSIIKHIEKTQAFDYNANNDQERGIAEKMFLLLRDDQGNQSIENLLDILLNLSHGFDVDFLYTTSMMFRDLIKIVAGLDVKMIGVSSVAESVAVLAGIGRLFEEMSNDRRLFRAMCAYACNHYADCVDTKLVALWYYQSLLVDPTGIENAQRKGITHALSVSELMEALEKRIGKAS